jgi:hypothetical protein
MENIFQPNEEFNFSQLSLAHPSGIQGGAYFTKIQMNNKPLYIEAPKSLTRQGFVKNGKKIYCDLMFDNNDDQFINWLENLEIKCQELIYKKGDSWFENKLEMSDIETAFASPIRVYKSGKFYLMRVNVKVNYTTNVPSIKIYNESELPITIDDVTPENYIISILEVQGIKFTSRNFQIEVELKQAMVLSSEKIFENCLIKTNINNRKVQDSQSNNLIFRVNTLEKPATLETDTPETEPIDSDAIETTIIESETANSNNMDILSNNDITTSDTDETAYSKKDENTDTNRSDTNDTSTKPIEQNDKNELELSLTEVNLSSDLESLETITLKKPNQVYYEIYKAARKKAKDAKKTAITAFLEAKNIKKTYMLEDLDDSEDSDDSDIDSDIDSDSDFDNLSASET